MPYRRSRVQSVNRMSPPYVQKLLLDMLFAHKADFARTFLSSNGLPSSGVREDLRERLESALAAGSPKTAVLVDYLDRVEGWGNQHVYLYRTPAAEVRRWRDEQSVRVTLRNAGYLKLLNKKKPIVLPSTSQLSSVQWTATRVRFLWIERRTWDERVEAKDQEDGPVTWKAYERRIERGVTAFEIDLATEIAMLMIQRLPSGNDYEAARRDLQRRLSPLFDFDQFELVRVSKAIDALRRQKERIRTRGHALETTSGVRVAFRSSSRKTAVEDDPGARDAEETLAPRSVGSTGNFYFLPKPNTALNSEMHTTVHAKDQRIGIFGDRSEEEVRYVIGCIREAC